MVEKASQFIKAVGGAHKLAKTLGLKPGTVRMWQMRNRIPRTAWPEIIEAFPSLTISDMKQLETDRAA